ncbi:YrbI family 3-deoxy-D-manno-octulosonate 8-phosphate phosphatase [Candidatus Omnitrophus magneticus]|uniref:3-deoxy-D-manno-octulosonate 8-phosphate phosphatase KdsC n=1 Tax=Candidatus Omnitrophus magneticus TaxID=1609969 RepID=A0A0F0CUL8_9BACT|nr:YrbI family 3-deoxy-D-manno-octulosonate 8-phosphate phosphatase [Candidatus Omnitrophus magneticus]
MIIGKYSKDIIERAKKIEIFLLDVDGVMTDGMLPYDKHGNSLKLFNVKDGFGIFLLKKAGLKCVIITAKSARTVTLRAKDLKINKVYGDYHYKIKAYEDIKKRFNVSDEALCFIGDDLIDIPVLKRVGLAVCPSDAVSYAKTYAHFTAENKGGRGAIREVCDLILNAKGLWDNVTADYFK